MPVTFSLNLVLTPSFTFSMDFALPQISISPPPFEEPVVEPYSPFSSLSTSASRPDEDAFRPVHLTPPPELTRFHKKKSSPLRPRQDPISPSKGLERERFEALLQSSRDRNAVTATKKVVDLRKEITLKAHKTKSNERRNLFLSKVLAPPSPTATLTPKTPPDSPAIFHYSLPSPGLVSPLSLFESLAEDATSYDRKPWVEHVDFRLPEFTNAKEPLPRNPAMGPVGKSVPSLDQISARLRSQGHIHPQPQTRKSRLPRFLSLEQHGEQPVPKPSLADQIRLPTLLDESQSAAIPSLRLSMSSTSRERRALDMLSTIKRRTQALDNGICDDGADGRKSKWKRYSAPADLMPLRQRIGFEHPVLALPGGF